MVGRPAARRIFADLDITWFRNDSGVSITRNASSSRNGSDASRDSRTASTAACHSCCSTALSSPRASSALTRSTSGPGLVSSR
ncbi:hypothetical protein UK23_16070 [Lentzea aerocolonigenes]|uniref:Uncharacterized protein n=1 Tax=Lentzea aerocolonigenes TaxID=68170 RepID=A0A0F0H1G7_LENAE|nr:hypothetical protein [Lentzea aerocolonigenes]KJK48691.1 hypothetical protein UK23_16070 [Lentzea aerocolonigenes]